MKKLVSVVCVSAALALVVPAQANALEGRPCTKFGSILQLPDRWLVCTKTKKQKRLRWQVTIVFATTTTRPIVATTTTIPVSTTTSTTSTTTSTTTTTTTTVFVTNSRTQAVRSAAGYLRVMAFSRSGLIRQLEFEGFSNADATYGVDAQNADWNAQAAKSAAAYLRVMSFSRSGLINQLMFEGFSQSQAEYGVNAVGL